MTDITCGPNKKPCRCQASNSQVGFSRGERGILEFCDGSKYEGNLRSGLAHGKGTLWLANGDKYSGQWENNNKHGLGSYEYASGAKFIGKWLKDKKHGQG